VEYATIPIWDAIVPCLGTPQTFVFDRLAPPVQDRLGSPQSGHKAQVQQDCQTTRLQRLTNPIGGHRDEMSIDIKQTTRGNIIKIGTSDVVIKGNNKRPMIFGKSAKTNEGEDIGATSKAADQKWCPSGLTRSQSTNCND
jgi:hypothetical protein